jgi:hypothetical protein
VTIATAFSTAGSNIVLLAATVGDAGRVSPPSGHPDAEHRPPAQDSAAHAASLLRARGRAVQIVRLGSATTDPTLDSTRLDGIAHGAGTARTCGHGRQGADLVIALLSPTQWHIEALPDIADRLSLCAVRQLRLGGTLAVLTHCDWTGGSLIDPTGAIVSAGQSADLLYLQHIIAVHEPVHPSGTEGAEERPGPVPASLHGPSRHTLPARHRRIHSDVLVFAQHAQPPTVPSAADVEPASERSR